jgi:hypothetical protein
VRPKARPDRTQLGVTARGLTAETFPLYVNASGQVPATQTVYYTLIGLRAGDVITNIAVSVNTAASGTAPTSIFVGLYDSAGNRVALSANLKDDAKFTSTGQKAFALTAAYTVPSDGGYYCAFLIDGTFASTNVQLHRCGSNTVASAALAGGVAPHGAQTGQTSLPSSATLSANAIDIWFGVN